MTVPVDAAVGRGPSRAVRGMRMTMDGAVGRLPRDGLVVPVGVGGAVVDPGRRDRDRGRDKPAAVDERDLCNSLSVCVCVYGMSVYITTLLYLYTDCICGGHGGV